MKNITIPITACLILNGCVFSNQSENNKLYLSEETKNKVKVEIVGVPVLLGGHGTKIPISINASLTALHVARFGWSKILWKDEKCDLAIISDNNKESNIIKFVPAKLGDSVRTYGYGGITMSPYTSKGILLENYKKSPTNDCIVTSISAPVMSGMSGGLVANSKGQGVAVITNIQHLFYKEYVTMTVVPKIMLSNEYLKFIEQ